MDFRSILFERPEDGGEEEEPAATAGERREMPAFFRDLHLDQLLERLTEGREEYRLEPFFCAPPESPGDIAYRQEVARDLEREAVRGPVQRFGEAMRTLRRYLDRAEKLYYPYQRDRWFLEAVRLYCDAVRELGEALRAAAPASRGLRGLAAYLEGYAGSEGFLALARKAERLEEALDRIRYTLLIRGSRVTVSTFEEEPDYGAEVLATFERFAQGAAREVRFSFQEPVEMNHVEAEVLEGVARLEPETFAALRRFHEGRRGFLDPVVRRFDREVQFYLAYLELAGRLRAAGLAFCYPELAEAPGELYALDTFDLVLAERRLAAGEAPPVCNDFELHGPERVLVVTGPNQGGKTTFARAVGQIHFLARLGLPVPGRAAWLLRTDRIFTHFEREEQMESLHGKLEEELVRVRAILEEATSRSLVVLNESFASTTLRDALFLGREILGRILERGALAVYVTFLDELSRLGPATVSMVSTVSPENPAERTFQLVRRPADGLAYAEALAEKYGLTYRTLRRRLAR